MTNAERTAKKKIADWKKSTDTELRDVYGRHSNAKEEAFNYCKELCHRLNGQNLKIVSHNHTIFTAGFQFTDRETGVIKYMHITPTSDTAVDM